MTSEDDLEDLLSTLYHALRAARRRYTIQFLKDTDEPTVTTRELARQIASVEQGVSKKNARGEPYRNAYNSLSQTHLPTLSEAGIIIYDPKRQTVEPGPHFKIAALLLDSNKPTVDVFASLVEQTNHSDNDE
jgi:hypothetical protein